VRGDAVGVSETVPAQPTRPFRSGLAVVSLGAAAIHFAAMGHHLDEYVPFGVFFAVVAWLQALWAVGIVTLPSRRLLRAGVVGSVGVIAVWVVSRTWGVPFGPAAGEPEAVSAADVAATSLEAVLAIGALGLLRVEARGARRVVDKARSVRLAGALSVLAIATTTVALAAGDGHDDSPSAHGGSGHGGSALGGADHSGHQVVVVGGEADPVQIDAIRQEMARYEDVDVARAEGWEQEHADEPETGAHFARPFDPDDEDGDEWLPPRPDLDLLHPDYLMYSKIGRDDWELVAVAYVIDQTLSPDPPTDLRGAGYHEHVWTCLVDGEELDEDEFGPISRDECRAREGEWSPGGVWMTHVWLIDNPSGPFAETNPALV